MTVALLFPGQGTQHAAMLPWLLDDAAARPALAEVAGVLGQDWHARSSDPAWAHANSVAQVLVTGVGVAAWSALAAGLPRVVAVAGYSVGELASCVAAGMLDANDAIDLAVRRAAAMDAVGDADAGLLGVADIASDDVDAACARWGLEIALCTGTRRCVLGGSRTALMAAAAQLEARGGSARLLDVRVASHTSAMRAAVQPLADALLQARWHPPRVAWVAGITGTVLRELGEVRDALARQVATTVRWDRCMDAVAERRPGAVLEIGPGTTLTRLWRERHPGIPARSCDEFASTAQVIAWVGGTSER